MLNIKQEIVFPKTLDKNVLYGDLPTSGIPFNKKDWDKRKQNNNKEVFQNEINQYGFRSDNFKTNHSGKHILFLGCSYTWGTGLFIDEVWSKLVYEKIKLTNQVDGYFNLGIPGDSIYVSIINSFKYFKNFNNPDIIFFNIQDLERFFAYDQQTNSLFKSIVKDNEILYLIAYHYYYMLEQYCEQNNIKLFSFSWNEKNNNYFKDFKTFYSLDFNKIKEFVSQYEIKHPNVEGSILARDNQHVGSAYHNCWAEHIYSEYERSV
jgi:hypothetical protein